MKPTKFKNIKTKRIELKPMPVTFDFANHLFNIIAPNKDFFKFMPWADIKMPEQEFDFLRGAEKNWKTHNSVSYGMYIKPNNTFIGVCSFFNIDWDNESGEIGYWLDPKYARHGYMSEAAQGVEKEFSKMGFRRIVIKVNVKNIASCKTAEKCGFVREGVMKAYQFNTIMSEYEDMALYAKVYKQKAK